jgi:hypothetical protein
MAVDPSAIAIAFLQTYADMNATGSADTLANLYVRLCLRGCAALDCFSRTLGSLFHGGGCFVSVCTP